MYTRQVCICILAAGSASAFFGPPALHQHVRSVSAKSTLRMDAGREANKAGDDAKSAASHLKEGAKQAVGSSNSSGQHQASKAGDDAKSAAQHLKEGAKQAVGSSGSSSSSSTSTSSTSDIRNLDAVGSAKRTEGVTKAEQQTVWEAPVEKTRIHERVEEVDKTRIEEQRIRTEVQQVVQPIKDTQRVKEDVRVEDYGTEVREHGSAGLDTKTEAELKRRREELMKDAGTVRDKEVVQTNLRPDVDQKEFVNTVQQVVPVIEKDVYVPKRVEKEKKIVEIYNEAPEIKATEIKAAITKEEFEKRYGGKVDATTAGTPNAYTVKETHSEQTSHTAGKGVGASSVSSSTGVTGSSSTARTTGTSTGVSGTTAGVTGAGVGTNLKTEHSSTHSTESKPAPYSMSSSNMAHDAEADVDAGDEAQGVVGGIKAKLSAVKDKVKDILD